MAVVTPTQFTLSTLYGHVIIWTWTAIGDSDTCAPVQMGTYSDRSLHVLGTFGGATITFVGSNEPTNDPAAPTSFPALHDPQGNALSASAAKILQVEEICNWIKPVTAGGGGSAVTVNLLIKSTL
jgi:hypothetical protein